MLDKYTYWNDRFKFVKLSNARQVNRCQAWYYRDRNGDLYLQSYNTLVAVYEVESKTLYSFGRYSRTTYQHVRKFRNNYLPEGCYTNEVNLERVNWF